MVKNLPSIQETWIRFLGREDPQATGMATHCSILAWRIPNGQRSLAGCSPWGHKESAMTERLTHTHTHKDGVVWNLSRKYRMPVHFAPFKFTHSFFQHVLFFFFLIFIWLHWVLVAAFRIFSCRMQTLSCGMWD